MAAAARKEIAQLRQIVIFPEGTRRSPGAEPRYLPGVAYLYAETGLPCVPVALNSGLFGRAVRCAVIQAPYWSKCSTPSRPASTSGHSSPGCEVSWRTRPRVWSPKAGSRNQEFGIVIFALFLVRDS